MYIYYKVFIKFVLEALYTFETETNQIILFYAQTVLKFVHGLVCL